MTTASLNVHSLSLDTAISYPLLKTAFLQRGDLKGIQLAQRAHTAYNRVRNCTWALIGISALCAYGSFTDATTISDAKSIAIGGVVICGILDLIKYVENTHIDNLKQHIGQIH